MKSTYLIVIVVMVFAACKKSSSNPPPASPGCYINKITYARGAYQETYVFEYDQSKRVTTIQWTSPGSSSKMFLSYPNQAPVHVEMYPNNASVWFARYDYSTWSDGTLKHIVSVYNTPGAFPGTWDYNHDNRGLLMSAYGRYKASQALNGYSWDNAGNLAYFYELDTITNQPLGDSSVYQYYLDKTYSDKVDKFSNSLLHLYNFEFIKQYGCPAFYTKNLLRTMGTSKSVDLTFTYEFDADGKVTKLHSVSHNGNTFDYLYEYVCQ